MKKLFSAILLALACSTTTWAQDNLKLLNVQETTEGIGLHPCGDRHEALVQFITHEPFALEFESTHDRDLHVSVDSIAGKKTYSIIFVTQAPGKDYTGRRVTIHVAGFQSYRLPLPLRDKQKFEFTVSDPYSALRSPFFVYLEAAQQAFQDGEYMTAKDKYELCRYCPEYSYDTATIQSHIAVCDSMMHWNNKAVEAEKLFRYREAVEAYRNMLRYHGAQWLHTQLYDVQRKFLDDCVSLSEMGQENMKNGLLDEAERCYSLIIANGCTTYTQEAEKGLLDIRKMRIKQTEHSRVLMAAWSPNQYGITWGSFFNSIANGWYATLMFNADVFKLMSQKTHFDGTGTLTTNEGSYAVKYKDKMTADKKVATNLYPDDKKMSYETTFAFGCDWNVWKPIFVHAGVGYHGGGFDTFSSGLYIEAIKNKDNIKYADMAVENWSDDLLYDCTKVNWFHSVAPEAGIVLKYGRVAAKATCQYSYWINDKGYTDYLKANQFKLQLGLGFCW